MREEFEIYEFRFVDKETKSGLCIYARDEAVAREIADIESTESVYTWVKPRFRKFKKPCYTMIPPYELEQEQKECALARLARRRAHHKHNNNTRT